MDSANNSCESQLIVTIYDIASQLERDLQVDIILLDFAKAFDKFSTSPPSTQVRILCRQPQNQQMDSLLPREQKANKFQYSWCTPRHCSWPTSTTCQKQQLHQRPNYLQMDMTAFFIGPLTTRLTVTYCRETLQLEKTGKTNGR